MRVHPCRPLVLSLLLVSISQLGDCSEFSVMLQWMGGSRRKVYAVSIQSLPLNFIRAVLHGIWFGPLAWFRLFCASLLQRCFMAGIQTLEWWLLVLCFNELWNAANIWLCFGGFGFCLFGPETSSPGSQHRAGTLVLSLISVSKSLFCGASHICFMLMKLSDPSLIKQCSADKGSTSNKRDGNNRGQSYRTRII